MAHISSPSHFRKGLKLTQYDVSTVTTALHAPLDMSRAAVK